MLKHFQEHVHNKFNRYALCFFFCEVANVCFSVFSVYLTHQFLLNQYLLYGVDLYRYVHEYMLFAYLEYICTYKINLDNHY